jgi:heme/copper-type cytochrome/quinol oxidase subunit 2
MEGQRKSSLIIPSSKSIQTFTRTQSNILYATLAISILVVVGVVLLLLYFLVWKRDGANPVTVVVPTPPVP